MKNNEKLIFSGILLIMIFLSLLVCFSRSLDNNLELDNLNIKKNESFMEVYQGPVPQGYNLEHFRKTGETIREAES